MSGKLARCKNSKESLLKSTAEFHGVYPWVSILSISASPE
jgi:hypothetical protein